MHHIQIHPWNALLLPLAVVLVGCAAGWAVSDGDDARERGETFAAANHYLDALDEDADHEEALKNLTEVAEPAYRKKLGRAEKPQTQRNLEGALQEYKALQTYLDRLREHNVLDFTTVDVPKRIRAIENGIAKEHYRQAEALFENRRYEEAITQYDNALEYRESYRDAVQQIAASYYQMATEAYEARRYRRAAETYVKALKEGGRYKDARRRAATLYYRLGDHFLTEGQCRKAYEDFSEARAVVAGFRDASSKLAEAKDCATVQVAFADLNNTTRRSLAGMNLGSVIFQKTRAKLQARSSPFIEILTRRQLQVLMEEQGMNTEAGYRASTVPRSFEGADYVVLGELNQVQSETSRPTRDEARTTYEYATQETYTNDEGETETRTEWREAYAYFTLVTTSRTIRMRGSVQVVDASSRTVVISQTIDEEARDEVRYASNIRADHNLGGDAVRLNGDFAQLMRADKRLKGVNTMVQPRLDAVAESMSRRILRSLDRPPSGPDPSRLDVSFLSP